VATSRGLGVIIPHYSRADLLLGALASVQGHPTWVVDDSPTGLESGALPSGVQVLRTAGEEGFARACNRGLEAVQQAGLPLGLLLNDDATPLDDCIPLLLDAQLTHPQAGALAPVLVDRDGRVESAGIRVHRHSARVHQITRVPTATTRVDALSGACLLLASHRRLDERYRFGFEDIALCRSLAAQGHPPLLVPQARCRHHGGATVPRRSRAATRHALAGHLRLVEDHPWQRPLVLGWALIQLVHEGGSAGRMGGLWEGWRDIEGF